MFSYSKAPLLLSERYFGLCFPILMGAELPHKDRRKQKDFLLNHSPFVDGPLSLSSSGSGEAVAKLPDCTRQDPGPGCLFLVLLLHASVYW